MSRGVVFGQALGDALGIYTENLGEAQIKAMIPSAESFCFPPEINSFMKKSQQDCHWTDDTDNLVLLLEMLVENNNEIDVCCFARKLKNWVHNGVPELGYTYGMGCGNMTRAIVDIDTFETNPEEAAEIVWRGVMAPNGSIMRCAIMACRGLGYNKTIHDASIMCKCTHFDPRCDIGVIVVTSIIWDLLHGTNEDYILPRARRLCSRYNGKFDGFDGKMNTYTSECEKYFDMETLDEMELNECIGYSLKCMAVGVWAFKNRARGYRDLIIEIVLKGGDADTNASAAGAILGAYVGFEGLPHEWIHKMPHKEWLDNKIRLFEDIVA